MKELKSQTGLAIPQQFSTKAQVEYMSRKAVATKKTGGVRITVVHPNGVGADSYHRLDGRGGADGSLLVHHNHKPARK